MTEKQKCGVLILIDSLHSAGAENVAVDTAIRLKKSDKYRPVLCATRQGGVLEQKLVHHNITHHIIQRNSFAQFYKLSEIKQIVKQHDIKLIHAHKTGSNFWGSIIGRLIHLPVISHSHGEDPELQPYDPTMIANWIGCVLSNAIVCVSNFERERYIKRIGINPSKVVSIYNGIDYKLYKQKPNTKTRKELGIEPKSKIVGLIAAFRPQKNHELILRAAKSVTEQIPSVLFLLVGDGPTIEFMKSYASELGIHDNCIFAGHRRDIPDIISILNIGVLSSHWEALPLSILEYMASSKPVVTTDVCGLGELVKEGVNGFLVPPGDSKQLAKRIVQLANEPKLATRMGEKGRELVATDFSLDTTVNNIELLYDEILGGNTN